MHPDEVEVPLATARALLDERPGWRGLEVRRVQAAGTVNAVFRLGEAFAARFPLRRAAQDEVRAVLLAEARAARRIAAVATVPTPLPVALGEPGHGYPMPWSVQTWLLDVGGSAAADPALDLVAAWHLLDDGPRAAFRERLGVDDLQWARGRAWAFEQAIGLVEYYRRSNPSMSALGSRTLARLVATAVETD